MPPPPPSRIGPWEVVRPLGQGGMGSVFVVEHAETRVRRALKLVRAEAGRDLSRARREVEALARVDGHPGVVRVHDCGELAKPGAGLGAAVAAARSDEATAEAALHLVRELEATRPRVPILVCPWRTGGETARQVAAARTGWRPWVAGRPWAP